jgi:hypothetical protein
MLGNAAGKRTTPPAAGIGRKKGVPNKNTRAAREAMQLAFQGVGGVKALTAWAKDNPTEFYKIYARLIPVETEVSGKDGGPIAVSGTLKWGDVEIPL